MQLKHTILKMVSFSLLVGCTPSKEDLIGLYTSSKNENNIDSLYLFENNIYKHSIYSSDATKKIYTQYGSWKFSNDSSIDLKNFYDNDDEKFKENFDYDFEKHTMLVNTTAKKTFDGIIIDINSDFGNVYEKKVDTISEKLYAKELKKAIKEKTNND